MKRIVSDKLPGYLQSVFDHVASDNVKERLWHYGVTGKHVFGDDESGFLILLAGQKTWKEITRIPRSHHIPQSVIGAYTHAALPLTASTQFAWRPNEALAIAANKFAYPSDFDKGDATKRPHRPEAVRRTYRQHFNSRDFDLMMDTKRAAMPYVYTEPITYRVLGLPKKQQPAWRFELQGLCEHLFWRPELHVPHMDILVMPDDHTSGGHISSRDIIRSIKVTGRGWSLLRRRDILHELTRVQYVLSHFPLQ